VHRNSDALRRSPFTGDGPARPQTAEGPATVRLVAYRMNTLQLEVSANVHCRVSVLVAHGPSATEELKVPC
jgi:hypothetical protein